MTNQKLTQEKPKAVILAVQLFWALIAVCLVSSALNWNQQIAAMKIQTEFPMKPELFMILVLGITFALLIWLMSKISAGRNWARIVWLILTVTGLPSSIYNLTIYYNTSILTFFLIILSTILSIYTCILLFKPSSNAWFKEQKTLRKCNYEVRSAKA